MVSSSKQTKNSIKLSWKAASGTSQYIVYGNKCGKGNKFKRITALSSSGRSFNVKQAAGAKLKKGVYYKFIVIAVDSGNNVISSSKIVHVSTAGNKKAANPKKVVVKAKVNAKGKKIKKAKALSKTVIKKGKTVALKSSFTKAKKTKVKKHAGIRYESSNPAVASVSSKGKIKGLKKGKAVIYAFAQNGINKKVKITVK